MAMAGGSSPRTEKAQHGLAEITVQEPVCGLIDRDAGVVFERDVAIDHRGSEPYEPKRDDDAVMRRQQRADRIAGAHLPPLDDGGNEQMCAPVLEREAGGIELVSRRARRRNGVD